MVTDRGASCEKHLLRLAARQHGVVTWGQALETGLTKSALQRRIRRGRLERIHPGVYRVGGSAPTFEQRAFAAAAWGGVGAVVSHSSAAHLWRMVETPPANHDILSPRKRTRPPRGICPHFTSKLSPRDRGTLRNIPITSPIRTLIDLAGVLPEGHVERALHQAIVDRRVTERALWARLNDAPRQGARGPTVLRRVLASGGRPSVASPLEREVARVLSGPGLPPFRREHPVYFDGGVYYLDFAWPHFKVALEADGRRWHSDVASFEHDRARHNLLLTAGWRVVRITEQQVRSDPRAIREQILRLIVRG